MKLAAKDAISAQWSVPIRSFRSGQFQIGGAFTFQLWMNLGDVQIADSKNSTDDRYVEDVH